MIITHLALIALAPVLFLSLMALAAASSLLLEAVMARFAVCCSALVLCTAVYMPAGQCSLNRPTIE